MIPKRHRKPVDDGEFSDPLKNYDIAKAQDELERALCDGVIRDLSISPFCSVSPISTIEQAVRKMAGMNIGCLLVIENDKLVGIFTQRDLLMKVIDNFEAMKGKQIREVMTPAHLSEDQGPPGQRGHDARPRRRPRHRLARQGDQPHGDRRLPPHPRARCR